MFDCLIDLKLKTRKKKDKELEKCEGKGDCEEKKAKKEIKKGKRTKKKQKEKAEKAKQPVEDLETVLEGLTLSDGTAGDDANDNEAICPKCGKLYSSDTENELWVCCDKCYQWYDFKCTKLRSKRRLPDTYICSSLLCVP